MTTMDNNAPFFSAGMALMAGGHALDISMPDPFLPPLDPMLGVEPFPVHFGRFPPQQGRSYRATMRDSKYNWVLDSGASHHMTGVKAYLFDYQPLPTPAVIQAAGQQPLYCVGKGTIRFTSTVVGVTHRRELHNVWHVRNMSISLLSTQALKRVGCQIFSGGKGDLTEYVVDSHNVCFLVCPHPGSENALNTPDFGVLMNDSYLHDDIAGSQSGTPGPSGTVPPADAICTFADAVHASDPESPDLWHQRLGHSNYQYLYQLVRNGLVRGITIHPDVFKKQHSQTCEVCVMSKHHRAAAGTNDDHAEHPIETLHSDVCVYPTPAIFGERYAVTLLDEYTTYAGVGLLLTKDQVEEVLKSAITLWETESGHKCKILFTDRGGEYLGNCFQAWLRQKGIKHHMSPPRTPVTNGRAERLNQTLSNAVSAMLLQYNLPKELWAHALLYATEIHNRGYNKALQLTPYQVFLKQVPSVHNFRTFGCKVLARLPETTRDKLDPKSEIGIYLGPSQDGPGHKVLTYQPHLKSKNKYKIHMYRDVVTFERLTDVCGVQATSAGALRWGGDMPLPRTQSQPLPSVSGSEEPMTGMLEPAAQPRTLQQLDHLLRARYHSGVTQPVVPALPAPQSDRPQ
jgi:transposase InsO family protein